MGTHTVLTKDMKCGTCQYWRGDRKIRLVSNRPNSVLADAGQYPCGIESKKTYGIGTCAKWKKWVDL